MLITTTEAIPGYAVERVLGLVEASTWSGLGSTRKKIARTASDLGANAIVAARYSGGSPSGTVLYGTAVVVRPE